MDTMRNNCDKRRVRMRCVNSRVTKKQVKKMRGDKKLCAKNNPSIARHVAIGGIITQS